MSKKICFVSSQINSTFGGGHSFLQNLLDELKGEYEFSFFGKDKFWIEIFRSRNFTVIQQICGFEPVIFKHILLLPASLIFSFIFFLKNFVKFKKADLVVFNASFTEVFFLLPYLKIFLKKPILQMIHSNKCPSIFYKTPLGKIMLWLWGNTLVTFVSKSQLKSWENVGLKPKNYQIIYNGIQISNFITKTKTTKNIGFLGRLEKEKGLDFLLDNLQKTRAFTSLGYNLKIAGDGNLKNTLKNYQTDLNLEYFGQLENPKKFLENLDLLIVPSRLESFGLVVCEAWERGIPVLCSDIEVFKELKNFTPEIEKNLIFKLENSTDFIYKLNYFLENSKDLLSLENQSGLHQLVEKNFSLKTMANKYQEVFEKMS